MIRPKHLLLVAVLGLAAAAAAAPLAAKKKAQPVDEDAPVAAAPSGDFWQDPTFRKQFLGSYGFQAEIEPRVSAVEREKMEEVLPLLSTDTAAAAEKLESLITPDSTAVFDFTLGNIYFEQEDLTKAADCYRRAILKFPSFRRAYKNLGLIQVRSGEFDDAIESLSKVIELGEASGRTFGLLGYAYGSTEHYVAAESAYRNAMLFEPDVLDWKLGLTKAVLKQDKYPEAIALLDELIARYPERSDFWLFQANAYIGTDQPLKAAENYEVVQRLGKATAASLQNLGDIYVNEGLWDLAVRAYGFLLDQDAARNSAAVLSRVEVLAQRGALEPAGTLLARLEKTGALATDPEARRKALKLQARLAVAGDHGAEAVPVLEQIVALDPLDGEALMLLGRHYADSDEKERAILYYERAGSIEGYEADAKVRLAQLLVDQSRYKEAIPLLKRAQEIRPRDDVASYLEQLERAARTQ